MYLRRGMQQWMWVRCLWLVVLAFPLSLVAQENTNQACSDGLDNDNDGLIDCADPDCVTIGVQPCANCPGPNSFADRVLDYDSGCFLSDPLPNGAIGAPDYTGNPTQLNRFAFLGEGGFIKLAFENNLLTNSGDGTDDLYVFEIGVATESVDVSVRPLDATTLARVQAAGLADANGDGYYLLGRLAGATSSIDLDALVPGFGPDELKFDAVEVRDIDDRNCSGLTPGADIDAVCALSTLLPDCAGVLCGTAIVDSCGVCLDPSDPNFNASCTDCAGVLNGTSIVDACGECLEPTDPNFNQGCLDCAGVPNGPAIVDDCGECLDPTDPSFNQSCADCAGVPNGTSEIDACGLCLEPTNPLFNQTCLDCNGVPNGPAIIDACGECLDPSDPAFNQSCLDCAGTPNGTAILDECGVCLEPTDPTFNQSCADCAGTPNGTAVLDECGVCLEPTDADFNQSCADCAGTPNGTALIDSCGVCVVPGFDEVDACRDCAGQLFGTAVLDDCGICLPAGDTTFNQSCVDCAGTPFGSFQLDSCGVCRDPEDQRFEHACIQTYEVYVPNAFSPNRDGSNDVLQIFARESERAVVTRYEIYDRWGNQLYRAAPALLADMDWWDGTAGGQLVEVNVYAYFIEVQWTPGGTLQLQGEVTLLR